MSKQPDILPKMLQNYGLSEDEAIVYLYLLKNLFNTALSISRTLHIGRTRVYRILDTLKIHGLVKEKLGERGLEFGAADPTQFEHLAEVKEREAAALKQGARSLITELEHILPYSSDHSKVLYYEGKQGLEQVTYNTIHTKGILRVFEVAHMSDFLDTSFSEDIRKKYVDREVKTRDLTNKPSFSGFTDVVRYVKEYSSFRYISPKLLAIKFETLIYNDVYVTYTYAGSEVFCVEIYNKQLAAMQKQLFDFIWKQAKPMKYIDLRGAAQIS